MDAAWICPEEFLREPIDIFGKELERKNAAYAHPDNLVNYHMLVRKCFQMDAADEPFFLEITADDYYKVYVNGTFVGQGPAPGYHWNYYYNRYDISAYLTPGENVIAVDVWYQGLINRVFNSGDLRAGMWAVLCDGDGHVRFGTDASWKYLRGEEYVAGGRLGYDTGFLEQIDGRKCKRGWKEAGFDDTDWKMACVHAADDYVLVPQPTRNLAVYPVKAVQIKELPREGYLLDFGTEVVGCLHITARGKSGDRIRVRFGEELDENNRVRYQMRCNCNYEEYWTLSGEQDELENYDYKAFRYVEVMYMAKHQTGQSAEPWSGQTAGIIPQQIFVWARHYPMEEHTSLRGCTDVKMQQIWELCERSVRLGTQETYVDCPSREKGQYLGDLAITAPCQMYLTGEPEMYRKALDNFRQSARIDVGLMAVAPGSLMQEIADYSLMYPYEVYRYYCYTRDLAYLREVYPTILGILQHFSGYEREDGLLCHVTDKWNLVDWPDNLRDGYDFDLSIPVGDGCHNVINAFYYGALSYTAKIQQILGITENTLQEKCERTKAAFLQAFYREEKKLFADSEISDHTALHANGIPLFFGLEPPEAGEAIAEEICKKGLRCGVYTAYFLLKGLANIGKYQEMYDLMTNESEHSWMQMIREGATTCFEAWGKEQKWNTSLCHPWASGPILLFLEDILGITYDLTMEEPVIASHLPWQLYEVELDLMTKNGIKKLRITC